MNSEHAQNVPVIDPWGDRLYWPIAVCLQLTIIIQQYYYITNRMRNLQKLIQENHGIEALQQL